MIWAFIQRNNFNILDVALFGYIQKVKYTSCILESYYNFFLTIEQSFVQYPKLLQNIGEIFVTLQIFVFMFGDKVSTNMPFSLIFCQESLRSSKHWCCLLHLHFPDKQSLLVSPLKWMSSYSMKNNDIFNQEAVLFIFRWDLPCSVYIVFARKPGVMKIMEMKGSLISLGYYWS